METRYPGLVPWLPEQVYCRGSLPMKSTLLLPCLLLRLTYLSLPSKREHVLFQRPLACSNWAGRAICLVYSFCFVGAHETACARVSAGGHTEPSRRELDTQFTQDVTLSLHTSC